MSQSSPTDKRGELRDRIETAIKTHRRRHCTPGGMMYYKHEDQMTEDALQEALTVLQSSTSAASIRSNECPLCDKQTLELVFDGESCHWHCGNCHGVIGNDVTTRINKVLHDTKLALSDAEWKADHRLEMFNQREQLIRDLQTVAMSTPSASGSAWVEPGEFEYKGPAQSLTLEAGERGYICHRPTGQWFIVEPPQREQTDIQREGKP